MACQDLSNIPMIQATLRIHRFGSSISHDDFVLILMLSALILSRGRVAKRRHIYPAFNGESSSGERVHPVLFLPALSAHTGAGKDS